MPEITGERAAEPEMAEAMVQPPAVEQDRTAPTGRESTGAFVSPMRLRLDDFSGEGERAPPEFI
ncbi:MAG: hypothetical protein HY718_11165 [Planctomycetes bacterium]|nr:hypothetical protein [Planctomycetota bacterium]